MSLLTEIVVAAEIVEFSVATRLAAREVTGSPCTGSPVPHHEYLFGLPEPLSDGAEIVVHHKVTFTAGAAAPIRRGSRKPDAAVPEKVGAALGTVHLLSGPP